MDRLLSFRLSALGLFRLLFSRPLSHVFGTRFWLGTGGMCGSEGECGEEAIACTWDQGGREGLEGVGKGLERGGKGVTRAWRRIGKGRVLDSNRR